MRSQYDPLLCGGWSADDWIGTSRSWTLDILAPEITAFCGILDPIVAGMNSIARLKAGDRLIFVVHIFHPGSPPVDRSSMSAHQSSLWSSVAVTVSGILGINSEALPL